MFFGLFTIYLNIVENRKRQLKIKILDLNKFSNYKYVYNNSIFTVTLKSVTHKKYFYAIKKYIKL
jgi:hypothetical protein